MRLASRSGLKARLLTGFLVIDLGFLWLTVIMNEMLVILYSSGLWIGYAAGLMWALYRSLVLISAVHFRYPQFLVLMIGFELTLGVMVSVADIWVYYATDCECMLQIDGAVARLVVRSAALAVFGRGLRKTKDEGRKTKERQGKKVG